VQRNDQKATIRDWKLVTALPFSSGDDDLASRIVCCASELVSRNHLQPAADCVGHFLRRFESLSGLRNSKLERAFRELSKAFPVEVFLMLWRRNQARKAGDSSLEALPYDFEQIQYPNIMDAAEIRSLVADAERRLLGGETLDNNEIRLLRSAMRYDNSNLPGRLEAIAARSSTKDQLETLCKLGSVGDGENTALCYPNLARALLKRARAVGPDCYEEIFQTLSHIGGVRSSENGEPDSEWKALEQTLQNLADEHADDPELSGLFNTMLHNERSQMTSYRRSYFDAIDGE